MKFLIETGSESHTTSHASMQVKFHGGEFGGQYLYQQKQFRVSEEWDKRNDGHQKWVTSVYELPEGTEIAIIGKSHNGNLHRIYRLDSSAEVLEDCLTRIAGATRGTFKGRLVLVRDVLESKKQGIKQSQQEGF